MHQSSARPPGHRLEAPRSGGDGTRSPTETEPSQAAPASHTPPRLVSEADAEGEHPRLHPPLWLATPTSGLDVRGPAALCVLAAHHLATLAGAPVRARLAFRLGVPPGGEPLEIRRHLEAGAYRLTVRCIGEEVPAGLLLVSANPYAVLSTGGTARLEDLPRAPLTAEVCRFADGQIPHASAMAPAPAAQAPPEPTPSGSTPAPVGEATEPCGPGSRPRPTPRRGDAGASPRGGHRVPNAPPAPPPPRAGRRQRRPRPQAAAASNAIRICARATARLASPCAARTRPPPPACVRPCVRRRRGDRPR